MTPAAPDAGAVPVLEPPSAARDRVPTAPYVRRVTADIAGTREGRSRWSLLLEVWAVLLYLGAGFGVVLGIAWSLGLGLEGLATSPERVGVAGGEVGVAVAMLALAAAVAATAARLGPVGVGGGGATWWLPLPVDRHALLRPDVVRWPLLGAAAGGAVALFVPVALGVPLTVPVVAAWASLGAAACAAVTAGVVAAQVALPALHRSLATAGDAVVVVGVLVLALLASSPGGPGRPWPSAAVTALAVLLAAVAAGLTAWSARRAGTIPGAQLRSHGATSERAVAAILSLDVRELGGALAAAPTRTHHRSVSSVPGGPRRVVVRTDLLLLRRNPRLVVQVVVAVALGAALARVPLLAGGVGLYVLLLVTGLWAARAAAVGARQADLVPALDRAVPLSQRSVRLARGLAPALVAAAWAAVALVARTLWADDGAAAALVPWLAVAPTWAAVLGAGAVRAAYRPPFRVSAGSAVVTPMGGRPATAGLERGLDVALVGTLPTAFALVVDAWSPVTVAVQAVVAVLVVLGVRAGDPDDAGLSRKERRRRQQRRAPGELRPG